MRLTVQTLDQKTSNPLAWFKKKIQKITAVIYERLATPLAIKVLKIQKA